MEQFLLEKYLENPSRKVVTRRENPVRIICTDRKHGEDNLPIVFLEQCHNGEFLLACRKDGRGDTYDTPYDLFFVDEEDKSQSIEIPFGAKDSEFIRDEYLIPEGCEARIEGNKVIIEKIQKEELTEFEKAVKQVMWTAYNYDDCSTGKDVDDISNVKATSKTLLDLARKELIEELSDDNFVIDFALNKGKQDALKNVPKWKKATEYKEFEVHVCVMDEDMCMDEDTYTYLDTTVIEGEYYIELSDLKTLPKEE